MRLIDADKLIEWIEPGHLRSASEKCFSEADLVGIIAAQPTAYDVDKVVEALEKQVPKKVNIEQWMDTKCKCGYVFSQDYEDGYYSVPHCNRTKYCPECGQRVDWSEEE